MDQKTLIDGLPNQPLALGFYVDGRRVHPAEREEIDRSSPAHDVPVSAWVG